MRVNPNEALSLFNVIFNVCDNVFGERADDLTIRLDELPFVSSKRINLIKVSPIDDNHYLDEGIEIISYDNGIYNTIKKVKKDYCLSFNSSTLVCSGLNAGCPGLGKRCQGSGSR